jgi:hypothetical protein
MKRGCWVVIVLTVMEGAEKSLKKMIEIPQLAAVHPPAQMIVKESPKFPYTEHTTHMILAELPKVPASRRPITQCVDYFRYRFDLLDLHTTRRKAVEDIKKRPIIEDYNIQIR